jgi:glutathione peroxidase-family protein
MRYSLTFLLLCVCLHAQTDPFDPNSDGRSDAEFRVWTSAVGTVMRARFRTLQGERATLQTSDGKLIEVDLNALSQADRDHIKTMAPATIASVSVAAEPPPPPAPAPVVNLPLPRSEASSRSAASTPLTRRIPVDETIEKIPLLKRKNVQPIAFSFYDMVRGKIVTSSDFKGKFVYVHTLYFRENMGETLQQLKLLHSKYAERGFEIISIHPYSNRNNPSVSESYEDSAVRQIIRRAIEDYGITWYISYPQKVGTNPLTAKFADKSYFDWLLDDQTRLIHSNMQTFGTVYMSNDVVTQRMPLETALKMIFPGKN